MKCFQKTEGFYKTIFGGIRESAIFLFSQMFYLYNNCDKEINVLRNLSLFVF